MTGSGSGTPFVQRLTSQFVSRDLARRDFALDALRGLMILGMILVNHPPPTTAIYPPLVHAAWHGWTIADTIFPGFLFAVGVSIRFAMVDAAGEPQMPSAAVYRKVLRRFALLMVLNFLLINFPYYFLGTLHFTGTLALIAWCYLIVALIHLHTRWRAQLALVVGALSIQWAVLSLLPVPGFGAGVMTPEANAATYIDRLLFTPLFGESRSSADITIGIVPTVGAVATTLTGLLVGLWISRSRELRVRVSGLFVVGLSLFALGNAWHLLLPVNKSLWTASYVLLMAGITMQLLAALYLLASRDGHRAWARPLQIAGTNALFFYVFAQSLQRLLVYGRIHGDDGTQVRLRQLIYGQYFEPLLPGEFGSLVFALIFLSICYAVVLVLYRKRIFFKL